MAKECISCYKTKVPQDGSCESDKDKLIHTDAQVYDRCCIT